MQGSSVDVKLLGKLYWGYQHNVKVSPHRLHTVFKGKYLPYNGGDVSHHLSQVTKLASLIGGQTGITYFVKGSI